MRYWILIISFCSGFRLAAQALIPEESYRVLQKQIYFDSIPEQKLQHLKQLIQVTILLGRLQEAELLVQRILPDTGSGRDSCLSVRASLLLHLHRYSEIYSIYEGTDSASLYFEEIQKCMVLATLGNDDIPIFREVAADRIKGQPAIEKELNRLKRLKPRRCKRLSYFLPGSGQFYCGNIKSGLNSFFLVGGLSTLFITTGIQYGWLSPVVSIAPWWQRYYIGGAHKAETCCIQRRCLVKDKIVQLLYK